MHTRTRTPDTKHAAFITFHGKLVARLLIAAGVLFLGLGLLPQPSSADGTHGARANVVNKSDTKIILYVFNGGDTVRQVPHKTYTVNVDENQRIKCHGNGKGRCWISNTLSSNDDDLKIYKNETCDLHFNIFTGLDLKNCR